MKKILIVIIVVFFCLSILGTHRMIKALSLLETIGINGNTLLPSLFYEHNLYEHKTENGDIIYCLDPDKAGTEISAYNGIVTNKLDFYSEQQIEILTSLLVNGYPNKLPGNPSRNFTAKEFYCITSMAVRALCMEFKGLTKGKTAEEYIKLQDGEVKAKLECIKLIEYAKKNPCTKIYNELSLKCLSDNIISDDGSMLYKEYMLVGDILSSKIKISFDKSTNNTIIFPDSVTIGNKFKIMVPIDETLLPIELKMTASVGLESYPVFIKAGLHNRQNYMGVLKVDQDINYKFDLNVDPNIAKLKIIKKDFDTLETLIGASFKVWSDKPIDIYDEENLLGLYETNAEGFIELNNLTRLGTYYIKEIVPPQGYKIMGNDEFESVEIVEFGKSYEKTIYNQQNIIMGNFIQIKGYKQVSSNQFVEYRVYGATNSSNVSLKNFSINIPIASDYYNLNSNIIIGEFEEKQGYLMYITDSGNNTYEMKKSYKDDDDYTINNSNDYNTRNSNGVYNCSDSENIMVPSNDVKEVLIKLAHASKGIEFKTPVFGSGNYSIYITDKDKEYLLGTNYDGRKENNFTCNDLRSYRIVFDKPININEFITGSFSTNLKSNKTYSVLIDTDKRKNIIIKDLLNANNKNIINISKLLNEKLLLEDEIINNVSIVFNEPVESGFTLTNPIILSGLTKDLDSVLEDSFNKKRNNLYYSNSVEISGVYKGKSVKNGDSWDTGSYSKELSLKNGKLPRTGSYYILLFGFITVLVGCLLLKRWRVTNE